MKKYLLALILVLAMAFSVMAAGVADNTIGGFATYGTGGGNVVNGWSAGGYADYSGEAHAQKFLFIPAYTSGQGTAEVTGNGFTFSGTNFAISGANGYATSQATELAIGSPLKLQMTKVEVSGEAYQANWAGIQNGYAWASGGNGSIAGYAAGSQMTFPLISFSGASGEANTNGFTVVGAVQTPLSSTSWGLTGNTGWATANCGTQLTYVSGAGKMQTGTYVTDGTSWAGTTTNAAFDYSKTGTGYVQGSGIATGYGQSVITYLPNGVKVSSKATSFSQTK